MVFDFTQFFTAKAWALLHDPPHKMWALLNQRCLGGSTHEDEARKIWNSIPWVGGLPSETEDLVREADRVAASFDRWVIEGMYVSNRTKKGGVFPYTMLHSIFKPHDEKYVVELGSDVDCSKVNDYVDRLSKTLKAVSDAKVSGDDKARLMYHVLYAVYELLWIEGNLSPSLADTRAPTHTIFDHNYATAAILNWLWPDSKPKGYFVLFDVPGIQGIVGASRKTGDFWAGSWLLSILTWTTAWPIVKRYGPDVLLTPTARLNPYYLKFLQLYLESSGVGANRFSELIGNSYGRIVDSLLGLHLAEQPLYGQLNNLIKHPLIPATMTLVIPKDNEWFGNTEGVKEKVFELFNTAYNCIVKSGVLKEGECRGEQEITQFIKSIFGNFMDDVQRILEKIKGEFTNKGIFDKLITPKVYVIDVREVYSDILNVLSKEGQVRDGLLISRELAKKLHDLREELKKIFGKVDPERLARYLLFHVVASSSEHGALRVMAKKVDSKEFATGKKWFSASGEPIGGVDFDSLVKRGIGWIYCTLCGNEPAIIRFGKEWIKCDERPTLTYDDTTIEVIYGAKNINKCDKQLQNLTKVFKPSEALGPLCLVKRLLYLVAKKGLGLDIETVEDVAVNWYVKYIYDEKGRLKDAIDKVGACEKVRRYLEQGSGRDVDAMFGGIERARREFLNCLRQIPEGERRRILNEVAKTYGIANVGVSVLGLRDSLVVIKADADNVGRLLNAELNINHVIEMLRRLRRYAELNAKDFAEDFDNAIGYVDVVGKVFTGGRLLISPTYRMSLSIALMTTALKDAFRIEYAHRGMVIFVGGDDVLALAPIDSALDLVRDLRLNYWGDGGFHKMFNYVVPAIVAFGRSCSLRFMNVMDMLNREIAKAIDELEDRAKETSWDCMEKDSIAISDSRTGPPAVLPLIGCDGLVGYHVELLKRMWLMMLSGELSGNVPEDYVAYAEDGMSKEMGREALVKVLEKVMVRNLKVRSDARRLAEELAEQLVEPRLKGSSPLADEVFKALRILRRYP